MFGYAITVSYVLLAVVDHVRNGERSVVTFVAKAAIHVLQSI